MDRRILFKSSIKSSILETFQCFLDKISTYPYFVYIWCMIKKILLGVGAFIVACIIMVPISSIIKNQTASDAIIVVGSILLALAIYKLLEPRIIK